MVDKYRGNSFLENTLARDYKVNGVYDVEFCYFQQKFKSRLLANKNINKTFPHLFSLALAAG